MNAVQNKLLSNLIINFRLIAAEEFVPRTLESDQVISVDHRSLYDELSIRAVRYLYLFSIYYYLLLLFCI